jgi:hypothetical protein
MDEEAAKTPPQTPWPVRMLIQEIAVRLRTAMEDQDIDLFMLAERLNWTPARLLQWIDGSLATLDQEDAGTLRDLVQLGHVLQLQWCWQLGKAKKAAR